MIDDLAGAWTAGDSQKFAEPFTEDADFVVWNGLYIKGRAGIAAGHERILSTIYKDTKLQFTVRKVRFLGDAVAVVHTEASVVKKTEEFPVQAQVVPVFVFNRAAGGRWQIVAFQNTKVAAMPENKK